MMNSEQHHMPKGGWIAAVVSALGAAVFFLWQPIMDYFITGTYDDNVVVQIDAETIVIDQNQKLLNIRVRALNKGSVPFKMNLDGKSELMLEVRPIDRAEKGQWVDPTSYPVAIRKNLIESSSTDLAVAPGSYWAKESDVLMPSGAYWLQARLHRKTGEDLTEGTYFQHGK